ncbi:MAG TPA: GNAT family N-acetyltransferase [Rhizomicrobium sp.]
MTTSIRRASDADAKAVGDVFLAARATMSYLPNLHTEDDTRDFIGGVVAAKETWVAERNGQVVGFAVIDGGWLEQLYVHPSRFDSGTGDKLFAQATRQHPQGFQLWVFQQNTGARRFYERHGCALEKLTDGADNEEKLPDALYVWPGKPDGDQPKAPARRRAHGTFEVKLAPLTNEEAVADPMLGRMTINKTFHGDLDATSKGQMLSAGTAVKGSAGYVAIEKVEGSLKGRKGSFVLQHFGIMTRGSGELKVVVVPDSGTAELEGLEGTLAIRVEDGKHYYDLDYTLAAKEHGIG